MVVGLAEIELHIPESNSLKDKRQVLKSSLETTRQKFNISMAEVDDLDLWRRATANNSEKTANPHGSGAVTKSGSNAWAAGIESP